MAENKKSFIAYCDWGATFNALPDAEAGQLVKHLFAYVNDENPSTDNVLINAVFANIKQQLKRDLVKWESKSEVRANAGRAGGIKSAEARRAKKEQNEANEANASISKQNEHDTVTVNVNDNVNDNVNEKKNIIYSTLVEFWLKEFHIGFIFNGAAGKALKQIIIKLETILKNENSYDGDDSVINLFKFICFNLPDWFKDKDLSVINSKLNEIILQIKNKNNGNTNYQKWSKISQYRPD